MKNNKNEGNRRVQTTSPVQVAAICIKWQSQTAWYLPCK